jgi:hypothetical protein
VSPVFASGESDDPVVVPLVPYVGRLVTVAARLGGQSLTLLLDTGGGQTLITPQVAARLGCTPHGRSVGLRMTGERVEFQRCEAAPLQVGGRTVGGREIAVWDVMAVLPKDLPPLDGVLALDRFLDQPFTLQLGARTLVLESPSSLERRVRGIARVEVRAATGLAGADLTVFVKGSLGEPGWFLFDSGNLDVTRVAPHMFAPPGSVSSAPAEATLTLAGLVPVKVVTKVSEIVYDGVLAESFLRGWDWTFRLATGELWAVEVRR